MSIAKAFLSPSRARGCLLTKNRLCLVWFYPESQEELGQICNSEQHLMLYSLKGLNEAHDTCISKTTFRFSGMNVQFS